MAGGRATGAVLLVAGLLVGVAYPFLLVYLDERDALRLLLYTAVALSILVGAFIGAVGAVLLRGFKPGGDSKSTG